MTKVDYKKHPFNTNKSAGIALPMFSMRSKDDWGIGDFASLRLWVDETAKLNNKILQILPIHELPPNETGPYSAISAFAIDPIYVAISEVDDFHKSEEAQKLAKDNAGFIKKLNQAPTVDYAPVKDLKLRILWLCFEHFYKEHLQKEENSRKNDFTDFKRLNDYWLTDYAVFKTMKGLTQWHSWTSWQDEGLRNHAPLSINKFIKDNAKVVEFHRYLQWVCELQWRKARGIANEKNVVLFGDLPFMVNQESADVWAHQDVFDINLEVGAPPDAFSADGQKWGLPAYNWKNLEKSNYGWWRNRMRRAAAIYTLIRLDHLVGFFRTWIIPRDGRKPQFDIEDANKQKERGTNFLKMVIEESGDSLAIAEDLGVIPPFVRTVLKDLSIQGYKIIRWERDDDGVYRNPDLYPRISLATTSTHDSDTLKEWWQNAPSKEITAHWEMVSGEKDAAPPYSDHVQEMVIKRVLWSNSATALFPIQDIIGTMDRVNTPGTVGPKNWVYRFNVNVEDIDKHPGIVKWLNFYKQAVKDSGRVW